MKPLCLFVIFIFTLPAYADGWEGSKVKVKKGALLCDYFDMETALILQAAGDDESIQALIDKGSCMRAPNDFFATVIKDASTFTDPPLAQIMVKGASIWGAMEDMECCYK